MSNLINKKINILFDTSNGLVTYKTCFPGSGPQMAQRLPVVVRVQATRLGDHDSPSRRGHQLDVEVVVHASLNGSE